MLEPTRECPRRSVTPDASQWIDLFKHYRNGVLAVAGGVLDQPAAYVTAMQIVQHWIQLEHDRPESKV